MIVVAAVPIAPFTGYAHAEADSGAEREAFAAAKELGTADAWNAFLGSFPTGFHADLARAYIKNLSGAAQPAAEVAVTAPPRDDLPIPAASWGGIVRDGPGQNHTKVASLSEGEPVILMARTEVVENGFPWFKIAYSSGRKTGYQWGGILCSTASNGWTSSRPARSSSSQRHGRRQFRRVPNAPADRCASTASA